MGESGLDKAAELQEETGVKLAIDDDTAKVLVDLAKKDEFRKKIDALKRKKMAECLERDAGETQQTVSITHEYGRRMPAGRGKAVVISITEERVVGTKKPSTDRKTMLRLDCGGAEYVQFVLYRDKDGRPRRFMTTAGGFRRLSTEDMIEVAAFCLASAYGDGVCIARRRKKYETFFESLDNYAKKTSKFFKKDLTPEEAVVGTMTEEEAIKESTVVCNEPIPVQIENRITAIVPFQPNNHNDLTSIGNALKINDNGGL